MTRYWIESRSTVVARKALRRRPKPSVEEVMREIALVRSKENEIKPTVILDPTDVTKVWRNNIKGPNQSSDTNMEGTASRHPSEFATGAGIHARTARTEEQHAHNRSRAHSGYANRQEDRLISNKADRGKLEDRISEIDNRALSLAVERREVLRQLQAAEARDEAIFAAFCRLGTSKARERESRLSSERKVSLEHRTSSSEVGSFYSGTDTHNIQVSPGCT